MDLYFVETHRNSLLKINATERPRFLSASKVPNESKYAYDGVQFPSGNAPS